MCSDGYYQTVDVVGRARFELTFVNHIPNLHFDLVTCTYRSRRVEGGKKGQKGRGFTEVFMSAGQYRVQNRQHTQPNSTAADSINHISVAHT